MFGFDEDLSAALCCLVNHLGLGCDFNAVSKALIAVLCCCLFFRGFLILKGGYARIWLGLWSLWLRYDSYLKKWWFLVDSPWGESSPWRCFDVLAESFERSCGRVRSQWLHAGGQLLGSCTTGGRMSQIIDFEKLDLLLGDSIDPQHGFVAASAYNQQHPSSLLSLLSGDSVHLWSQHVGIHFPGATSEEWTGNIWGSVLKEQKVILRYLK